MTLTYDKAIQIVKDQFSEVLEGGDFSINSAREWFAEVQREVNKANDILDQRESELHK